MYKSCPLECKILKGIWKNAYANDNVFCTTLYIFNFSDPYLFLRVFIFKSLSFPQSLYFLLYIISIMQKYHKTLSSYLPKVFYAGGTILSLGCLPGQTTRSKQSVRGGVWGEAPAEKF